MNAYFWAGFSLGMAVASIVAYYIHAFNPTKEEKKENDCWVNKPVIHEEHLHPVNVGVAVEIPFEELSHTNDKYNERLITDSLKLKMMEKLWEYVRVTEEKDPKWFCYRYHATIRVLLPSRDALRYELTKQES